MTAIMQPTKVMEPENWISLLIFMHSLLNIIYLMIHPVIIVGSGVAWHSREPSVSAPSSSLPLCSGELCGMGYSLDHLRPKSGILSFLVFIGLRPDLRSFLITRTLNEALFPSRSIQNWELSRRILKVALRGAVLHLFDDSWDDMRVEPRRSPVHLLLIFACTLKSSESSGGTGLDAHN